MTRSKVLTLFACLLLIPALLTSCGKSHSNSTAAAPAAASQGDTLTCPTSNTIGFAKTKFVTHAALGTGAFQHWIYKPYKNQQFSKGAKGRVMSFVKAGAAALFVKHELRLASEDAKASPALCKAIAKPISDLTNKIGDAVSKAKSGDFSMLDSMNTDQQNLLSASAKQGDTVTPDESADITKPGN